MVRKDRKGDEKREEGGKGERNGDEMGKITYTVIAEPPGVVCG